MSKDSSGESLEEILASIRRSLAEQTTSVLEDEAVAPAELLPAGDGLTDLDTPPLPASLSQRLAAAPDARQGPAASPAGAEAAPGGEAQPMATESPPVLVPPPRIPILTVAPAPAAPAAAPGPAVAPAAAVVPAAAPVVEVAPAEVPAAAAPALEPAPGQKDPLWFLSQAASGSEPKPPRAPEPKPSPLGSVRGPLPPFFGSSAEEVVKVEMVPDALARPGTGAVPPPSAHPLDGVRTVSGDAPGTVGGAGGARTSSLFGAAPADATSGGAGEAPAQVQALETMVAELLRPMLRRWLDENMPRLVSAALKAEAELMSRRNSGRDPKKP